MLCLFRNSVLQPSVNRIGVMLSWLAVLAWLYFSFVEKELWFKLLAGDAILVDLLLGIPLVLMLAVVVYATVYWSFKLLIIALFPQAVMPVVPAGAEHHDLTEQETEFGSDYWQDGSQAESSESAKRSAKKSEDSSSRPF
ncbi:hypothetical protein [Thiomicrorhabdus cannonii]|uniref:hypothetical protein n=1 Tax=Thiomicrorhabdus cannonii TaxID=2748011 RepID=UPI0015BA5B72|nr:hypothetical protein [Thiomicrorhabdus cannonii]